MGDMRWRSGFAERGAAASEPQAGGFKLPLVASITPTPTARTRGPTRRCVNRPFPFIFVCPLRVLVFIRLPQDAEARRAKQLREPGHRQTDDVRIVAVDTGDEQRAIALDRIGARLVH